ncbi:hypothetical protein [Glycomyces salinus]|uniref:hypothetical protein n=1 Tax=Glycomyces salinus TaxID=980294 RepID=UPI0018EC686A|nr:hypothetical protein [Glycomyces salinus]
MAQSAGYIGLLGQSFEKIGEAGSRLLVGHIERVDEASGQVRPEIVDVYDVEPHEESASFLDHPPGSTEQVTLAAAAFPDQGQTGDT